MCHTSSRLCHWFYLRQNSKVAVLLDAHCLDLIPQVEAQFYLWNSLKVPESHVYPMFFYVKEHVVVQETLDSNFLVSRLQEVCLYTTIFLVVYIFCCATLPMRSSDQVQITTMSHDACFEAKSTLEQGIRIFIVSCGRARTAHSKPARARRWSVSCHLRRFSRVAGLHPRIHPLTGLVRFGSTGPVRL